MTPVQGTKTKRLPDLETLALPSPGREVVGLPCLAIIIIRGDEIDPDPGPLT